METYALIASTIIKEQETIIGPVALEQAKRVTGLEVTNLDTIKINGDAKHVIADLVEQYAKLFGRASIELCKEAVRETKLAMSPEQLPDVLR